MRASPLRLLLLLLAALFACGCAKLPPDAELRGHLRAHRAEFERLRKLLTEDAGLIQVGPEVAYRMIAPEQPTRPATAAELPPRRHARYRALFRALDLPDGIRREGPGHLVIPAATVQRSGLDAEQKGWLHTPRPPAPLLPSLDAERLSVPLAYARVEGDWYLYREYLE